MSFSSVNARQQQQPYRSGSPAYDSSPGPSSGAATPANGSFIASSVSSLWGGLVRHFSISDADSSPSTSYRSRTFPSDGGHTPPHHNHHRRRTPSPTTMRGPPPLEPLQLRGFAPDTPAAARLLTPAVAEEIRTMVPARLSLVDEWRLIYSLEQDGASLATLYDKCSAFRGKRVGYVLVVRDCEGGTFGAYLSDLPRPAPKYFGTGECFLWKASILSSLPPPPSADTTHLDGRTTTIPSDAAASSSHNIRFKAFPYSGVNEYFMLCESHFLSVGAGDGRFGLWLDDGLAKGISSPCETFGNERLSDEGDKFGVLGVEVWVVGG